MIKHLSYHVRFRHIQRVLVNTIDFGQGMTAIVGPNEAGKSFVVEMIRYAFFGSAALRDVAEDYEELRVKLIWKDYEIERTPKGGRVRRGDEVLATGTRALNAKVIEVLGFGLDVFDIACVCNQGDVERLGAMPASERKAMVDRVIGASRIEEVQKWAAEQQNLLVREVAVLERGLAEPTPPVKPEGYRSTADLRTEVAALRALKTEHDELVGWLRHKRAAPVSHIPPLEQNENLLKDELDDARYYGGEVKRIKALTVVDFSVDAVTADWVAHTLWKQKGEFEKRHPRPTISEWAYADEIAMWQHKDEWDELTRKSAKLTLHPVECPHCHSSFCLEHDELAKIDAALAALGKPEREPSSKDWVGMQRRRLDDWANKDTIATWELLKDAVETPQPKVSQAQLAAAQRGGHVTTEERDAMLDLLRAPKHTAADIQKALDALHRFRLAMEAYDRELAAYDAWAAEWTVKQGRMEELAGQVKGLPVLEALLKACDGYSAQLVTYLEAKTDYEVKAAELDEKRTGVAGWKAARQGLGDVRTRVKTYLVPSLSKVASSLLNQMTDGQRSAVVVDEEFDVLVDGQRLETLSGSGKAVANLALRIALGQVLTNRVVSLFIGDEIDASMDDTRAAATHSSIGSLRGTVLQTILVSHKSVDADFLTTLNTNGNEYQFARTEH